MKLNEPEGLNCKSRATGSWQSMQSYILTHSRLKRENLWKLGSWHLCIPGPKQIILMNSGHCLRGGSIVCVYGFGV